MVKASSVFELEADGYTHAECQCEGCGYTVLMPFPLMRRTAKFDITHMTLAELGQKLICQRCPDRPRPSVIKPWRQRDAYSRPTILRPLYSAQKNAAATASEAARRPTGTQSQAKSENRRPQQPRQARLPAL